MSMAIDKETLFKVRLPEDEVEIPGVGTVRVRGLSRGEVFGVQKVAKGEADYECRTVALAMVDPVMTAMEVQRWQEASPAGELEPLTEKIQELSGVKKTSEKEAVLDFEANPANEFEHFPGGEAEHDGGADSGDE